MRLIDADTIQYHDMLVPYGNGQYKDEKVAYKGQIDDLPAVGPGHLWIPCSSEMPKADGEYLCWGIQWDKSDRVKYPDARNHAFVWPYSTKNGAFGHDWFEMDDEGNKVPSFMKFDVLAWQPIEPY